MISATAETLFFGFMRGDTKITFDVVLGVAGGADPAFEAMVEFDLADVGAQAGGQRVVGDARQLDVVDVAVAIGADVSRGLVEPERGAKRSRWIKLPRDGTPCFVVFFLMLLSPEVNVSQVEGDARLRNPDGPVGHHHLLLLHGARQPSLPSDQESARLHVHTSHAEEKPDKRVDKTVSCGFSSKSKFAPSSAKIWDKENNVYLQR